MIILLLFAFFAGIATVLSPCILPVLPAILSASASGGRGRPIGVILGLILSFIFFTLTLTTLVQFFGFSANFLRDVAIVVIGIFGIILLVPSLSEKFAQATSSFANIGEWAQGYSRGKHSGFVSGLMIGAALGLVWTPCAGPILAAITTLVATQKISIWVFFLTVAYSLGAALPLFLIAYGGQKALNVPALAKHTEIIRKIFGALMILTSIALALNWDVVFQQKVLDYFPSIQVEKNRWVREQLQQLRGPSPFARFAEQQNKFGEEKNANLPLIAPAPLIKGITEWINSPPLSIEQLKGKVVLIDFWTYSCINCIRTLPYLRKWYETYKNQNFVIIGVHTPEFEFEKDGKNVKNAVERFQLSYPIALDNQYQTWESFYNSYWPAHYLIDQNGIVRQVHFGEGKYLETENAIRSLLNLSPLTQKIEKATSSGLKGITSETYLGYKRANAYSSQLSIVRNEKAFYREPGHLESNEAGLQGEWTIGDESILSGSDQSALSLNFLADRVYLVFGGKSFKPVKVLLDGKSLTSSQLTMDMNAQGEIFIKEPRKYDVINLNGQDPKRRVLTLIIPEGIEAYAFTFGSNE